MNNQIQATLRTRAKELLENGIVAYVIGWEEIRGGRARTAFIRKPEDADKLVFNESCVTSTAKYLLSDRWGTEKIGICVRGCDARAVNRILADNQFNRERLYILGIPCEGVDSKVCERCAHRNPVVYDELVGAEVQEQEVKSRFDGVIEMENKPLEERMNFWEEQFTKCIRCYACRNACPACNCRECYADQYRVGWQGKQLNAFENRIYGLTRAYHVGDRCIECGECERVCPMELPIMLQTGKMLRECERLFGDYECGLTAENNAALGEYTLDDADTLM